jgi:hypothetical protein
MERPALPQLEAFEDLLGKQGTIRSSLGIPDKSTVVICLITDPMLTKSKRSRTS